MKVKRFVREYANWKKERIESDYYYTGDKFEDIRKERIERVERAVRMLARGLFTINDCMGEIMEA